MNIIIFGASGLIGQALVAALKNQHQLTLVGRNKKKCQTIFHSQFAVADHTDITGDLLAKQDIIINLAGENIGAKRWAPQQKKNILDSRINTTKMLADHCAALNEQAPRLLNASAIGVYGATQSNTVLTEQSVLPHPPNDFLAEVGAAWEAALIPAINAGCSVAAMRFGVVLAKQSGALAKILPSFRLGFGAVLGDGQQFFSWVALADVVRAIIFLIEHPQLTGPFNIVANETVTQKQFANTLASVLNRPCFFRIPTTVVELLFGEMGSELLLKGIQVNSQRLHEAGFQFSYPNLQDALNNILK